MSPRAIALFALATVAALAYDPAALAAQPKTVLLLAAAIALAALAATRLTRLDTSLPLFSWCALSPWLGGAALGAAGVALVACGLPRDERIAVARATCLAVGGGAGAIATAQWVAGARGMHLHGAMGNPDWLGLLLAITLVPSLLSGIRRPWVALSIVLQLLGWLGAESRAAWLALPVGVLVAFVAPRHRIGRVLVPALIAASLAAALLPTGAARAGLAGALAGRFWIWKSSLAAAIHAFPWGTGVAGFPAAYLGEQGRLLAHLDVADASHRFVYATTAHNEWLHALAALGGAGLLLLGISVATGIDHVARHWPAGAGATAALAVGASADVPLQLPAIAVVAALIWATAPRLRLAYPRAIAVGMLVLCAISVTGQVRAWRATRAITHARDALPAERARLLAHAAALAPRSADAQFQWGSDQVERGDLEAGLASLERARAISETVSTDIAIGNALVRLGRLARARDSFRRALSFDPGSFRAHANLAVALVGLGALDDAARELGLATRLFPGHPKLALVRRALERARLERASGAPPSAAIP